MIVATRLPGMVAIAFDGSSRLYAPAGCCTCSHTWPQPCVAFFDPVPARLRRVESRLVSLFRSPSFSTSLPPCLNHHPTLLMLQRSSLPFVPLLASRPPTRQYPPSLLCLLRILTPRFHPSECRALTRSSLLLFLRSRVLRKPVTDRWLSATSSPTKSLVKKELNA